MRCTGAAAVHAGWQAAARLASSASWSANSLSTQQASWTALHVPVCACRHDSECTASCPGPVQVLAKALAKARRTACPAQGNWHAAQRPAMWTPAHPARAHATAPHAQTAASASIMSRAVSQALPYRVVVKLLCTALCWLLCISLPAANRCCRSLCMQCGDGARSRAACGCQDAVVA